ncbi:hypothetical protein FRC16_001777 [Serendipita sp. 398]|nr:hypothetical protein FRC16_001777 [Serendipita sp. 398]
MYWTAPRPPEFRTSTTSKRRTRDRDNLSAVALPTTVERKHVFLYSSLSLPLRNDDEPSSPVGAGGGLAAGMMNASIDAIMLNKQQALAAVRRRMSYGRAEASRLLERARRKKSAGTAEEAGNVFSALGLGNIVSSASAANGVSTTNLATGAAEAPAALSTTTSPAAAPNTSDPMNTAAPWTTKTFMFHLPLQRKDGSAALLPPSVDLRAEAQERDKGKTKLVDDARIQYKLVIKYESGLLSLSKQIDVPIIFEPGSDPDSFYAAPQPPIKWRETPLEMSVKPETMEKLPFRAMLTLPNPPVFARDSESFFFVAFATTPHDKDLSSIIATNAKISLTISCVYRFDPHRAAAHTSRATNDANPALSVLAGKEERVWKWHEPPTSPLKRHHPSRRGTLGTMSGRSASGGLVDEFGTMDRPKERPGSRQTTFRKMTGEWSGTNTPRASKEERRSSGESGTHRGEKPLPVLPPETPTSETGGPISTPLPPGGFKDDHEGETTVVLLSTSRTGFPHRPKVKPDQANLPEGLWKGQLNYQWWMIPTLDWAGLNVKYFMEVEVEIDGMILKTRKEFRIVEPHIVRKQEKILQTKKVELDGYV